MTILEQLKQTWVSGQTNTPVLQQQIWDRAAERYGGRPFPILRPMRFSGNWIVPFSWTKPCESWISARLRGIFHGPGAPCGTGSWGGHLSQHDCLCQ